MKRICLLLLALALAAAAAPPNLLIVFPDQMRGSAMGFLDEEPVRTPRLDRFAADSLVFTHAASNYPICSPFRAMFMTGQYPFSNGVTANCLAVDGEPGVELDVNSRTWSDVLAAKGYSLGYIGKWHLEAPRRPYIESYNNKPDRAWNEWTPPARRHGFGFWYAYNTYDQHLRPMYWAPGAGRQEFHHVDEWGPKHEADKAVAFLRNERGQYRQPGAPFCLVVSMNPPHTPYSQVPEEYVDLYEDIPMNELTRRPNIPPAGTKWGDHYRRWIRHYYGMITGVDEQFGRILDALDEQGLAANTLVVFTADHGDHLGILEHATKGQHYEESMRIPLIFRYPGKIQPRRDDLLFSVPDLYPTILDLMGFANDVPGAVEGTSHAQVILTGDGPRPTSQVYLSIGRTVGQGNLNRGSRGVRTHAYTLRITRRGNGGESVFLHDNRADPYQLVNIAAEHPDIVQRLTRTELRRWLRRIGDPWLQ